ncbi:MAG: adenylate/guanylate cyclase domain-containing protein [Elusimicrobia bacterium]|nr:adenylate/guanylate cyclase domain-containing protein [Elusimicrobiota bacterium]
MEEPELDVDKIIEERERLDRHFREKYTRTIAVMFTDLKGSTTIAETHGDFAVRSLLKQHNDILIPAVKKHNGVLVKTMGDGSMSYYDNTLDALRAGCEIQRGIDAFNMRKTLPIPILMRIGIHYGQAIVEQKDIFGDVVNVASRIEGAANPGEIYLSEETYLALSDRTEIHCGFVKEALLKGKKEPFRLYKAYWNPSEIHKDVQAQKPVEAPRKGVPMAVKVLVPAAIAAALGFAFLQSRSGPAEETRSKSHDVQIDASH